MIMMKTGAIYSIYYSNYHLNQKVYAFILYGGPMSDKVHALNLGAIQLSLIDRYKLLRTIKQLISIPESSKYDGALLYQIFKQYNWSEIRKCYRTYKHEHIAASSLINYGLNKEQDFTPLELSMQNKPLFQQASVDYLVKMMNLYTGKSVAQQQIKSSLATDKTGTAPATESTGADSTQQSSATGMKTETAEQDKTFVKKEDTSTTKPATATAKTDTATTTKPNTYTPKQNTTNQTGTTNSTDNTGSTKKSGGNNKGGNGGIKGMY